MCLATGAAPAPVAAGEREPLSNSSSASERTVLAVPISLPDAEVILQAPKLKGHRRNSSHGRLIDEWDNLLGGHAGQDWLVASDGVGKLSLLSKLGRASWHG